MNMTKLNLDCIRIYNFIEKERKKVLEKKNVIKCYSLHQNEI